MESQKKFNLSKIDQEKERNRTGNRWDIEKKTNNMADLNSIIPIIILNINYLETLSKFRDSQNKECYQG